MENNLVLKNTDIITMNPAQPRAWAVAVKQGRIAAVGTEEDVRPYENGSPVIDCLLYTSDAADEYNPV